MNKKIMNVIAGATAILLLCTGCTTNAAEKPYFQGVIESEDVDINAKIPGRVLEVAIEEGMTVEAGTLIANIDAKDIAAKREGVVAQSKAAEAAVEAAKAQLEAAKAVLDKAKAGARSQDIAKAQASYDIYKKNYDRLKELYDNGAVSLAQVEEVETAMIVAKETLNMAKEGARVQDIQAATAQVAAATSGVVAAEEKYAQAIAGIKEVDTYLDDAGIESPLSGIVTLLNTSEGEMVSTGMNIATITNLDNTWVMINVDETKIAKFEEGQKVKVTTLAYEDQSFEGTVVRINKNADFAVKKASNENGDFDLVSYGVKVQLENPDHLFRPGMTAFVTPQE
ncbi:MAG: HlyD family secretion protein [Clostridia bacterium]|nr:HlyD family secretion protein [Clostridia bacterium]